MTLDEIFGIALVVMIPVSAIIALRWGTRSMTGRRVRFHSDPAAFWVRIVLVAAALLAAALLLQTEDLRTRLLIAPLCLLLNLGVVIGAFRDGWRNRRLAGTSRTEHQAAYWSAMLGLALFTLLCLLAVAVAAASILVSLAPSG